MDILNTRAYQFDGNGKDLDEIKMNFCDTFGLNPKKFKSKRKGRELRYKPGSKVVISGEKITVDEFVITHVTGDKYKVKYTLDAPRFGIFRLLVVICGLAVGVVPGVVLGFILYRTDTEIFDKLRPFIEEFEIIAGESFGEMKRLN